MRGLVGGRSVDSGVAASAGSGVGVGEVGVGLAVGIGEGEGGSVGSLAALQAGTRNITPKRKAASRTCLLFIDFFLEFIFDTAPFRPITAQE
jgi:hypothetical protein